MPRVARIAIETDLTLLDPNRYRRDERPIEPPLKHKEIPVRTP
jgi:hypothetical protein